MTCWSAGRATTPRTTRESRRSTSPIVRSALRSTRQHLSHRARVATRLFRRIRPPLQHLWTGRTISRPEAHVPPRLPTPFPLSRLRQVGPVSLSAWCPPMVGATLLYWWPAEGWQLGRVARPSTQAPYSHVVRYRRPGASFTGNVDTLLDAGSYGTRWTLLARASPTPAPGSLLPSAFRRAGSKRRENSPLSLARATDASGRSGPI